jgi:hypothetical protein
MATLRSTLPQVAIDSHDERQQHRWDGAAGVYFVEPSIKAGDEGLVPLHPS